MDQRQQSKAAAAPLASRLFPGQLRQPFHPRYVLEENADLVLVAALDHEPARSALIRNDDALIAPHRLVGLAVAVGPNYLDILVELKPALGEFGLVIERLTPVAAAIELSLITPPRCRVGGCSRTGPDACPLPTCGTSSPPANS
jgi:hypothetical protein